MASACPSGGTPLTLLDEQGLPDGGKIDWYVGEDNPYVPVPPADFDPLVASDQSLALYGLPPRPTDNSSLQAWDELMSGWRPTPDAGLCAIPSPVSTERTSLTTYDSFALKGPWSGYVADSTTTTYIAAQGDYYQPAYHTTYCSHPLEGSWTGVGGFASGSGGLIQTGTAVDDSASSPVYYAWREVYPWQLNAITLQSVVVHPGDRIHTYVVYQRSTGKTTFYVADNTSQTYQTYVGTTPSQYYDGRSAEAIDEGGGSGLVNFGSIGWYNLQVQKTSGTWYSLGSQSPLALEIYSNLTKHILAEPGDMTSSTTFTDYWYNCD